MFRQALVQMAKEQTFQLTSLLPAIISGCTFQSNSASSAGGGLYLENTGQKSAQVRCTLCGLCSDMI